MSSLLASACLLVASLQPEPAAAWSAAGHRLVTKVALAAAGDQLPAFLGRRAEEVADASLDPDVIRLRALPVLRAAEYPEHYLDLELLAGSPLPADRYAFLDLLAERGLDARRVGTVPYAIVEATEHLAVALAEVRLRPDDDVLEAKAAYRAGVLAHYAADVSQPLHTSIHHDGRASANGSSPGTGIHHLVDTLFERAEVAPATPGVSASLDPLSPLLSEVEAHLLRTHRLVDRVYELEPDLEWEEGAVAGPAVKAFAADRLQDAATFTARLFVTAAAAAETLRLPGWRAEILQRSRE